MCSNSSLIFPAMLILFAAIIVTYGIITINKQPPKRTSFLECSREWVRRWRRR